ncbi:alpha-2-macroglobulin [Enterovirga sp.]|uniref:alpha-2-macroglobulin n=1 Tax=Enterovirga sp. TaxID=2026350 RepID=UPI002BFF602E|nr:alpha-2-macroglobulin [Enterovirga sp.]HMO29996.1 alpha-2-macroglobulin [Enterovirga sp.]
MPASRLRSLAQAGLLALALCSASTAALAQKSYVRDNLASEGIRLEDQFKRTERASPNAAQARRDGEAALGRGDARRALALFTGAIVADPKSGAAWEGYARAAIAVDTNNYGERYTLRERATIAAYVAYQRAASRADEARALALLGEVYALGEYWRSSLDAYRASLQLADVADIRATYEDLRAKHGFRITDYKVDSDSAAPRACFQFSEALAGGRTDFTPFVAVSGTANAAVTTEGQELCVDGLKHGQKYAIVLRQGLPSAVGESLLKSADYDIYVKDRSPQVRFTGRNYVLPKTGQEGIPVVSVNASEAQVEIFRIGDRSLLPTVRGDDFLSQLSKYQAGRIAREKGVKIWTGRLAMASELNRDVVTAFPIAKAIPKMEPGIYVMTAIPAGSEAEPQPSADDEPSYDETKRSTQWFVVSDLGLTALKGNDGIAVIARSLATGQPVRDVEVRLVARNNEVLATRTTDASGRVQFDPGLARGEGGMAPGLVVATLGMAAGLASGQSPAANFDYGFLDLGGAPFDLSDRGVKGRAVAGGMEAFLYTERGVYRSGETVNLTALLRDSRGVAASGSPLTLVMRRPDGVEYKRDQVADMGLGGRAWSVSLLNGAQRGTWRALAYLDPKGKPVGEASFLVEDYVPERLELTLAPRAPALRPGEPAQIDLSARYLYGAPGAGLEITGEVVVQAAASSGIKGLDGFEVGLSEETIESSTVEMEEKAETGPNGKAVVTVPIQAVAAPRPTEAKITLRVAEPGGRAIERNLTLPILPEGPVLGVKKTFGDLGEGANATFDVVLADPDGTRLARQNVGWSLYRVERSYQWFNSDGRWGYEPVKSTRRVADGRLDLAASEPGHISAPVKWGTYRLDLSADGISTARTSITFSVGYSGEQTADTPDLLEISLDKASYTLGETMRAQVKPRFAGRVTLAVMTDAVQEIREVDLPAEGTTVSIPVKAEWGAGAYLVATAFRPLDTAQRRMPGRALGLAWFSIDKAERTLGVSLDVPEKMRPRGTLRVPVRLAGLQAGEEAYVTVAAVDVGILNLTRYTTPDPAGFFFGQKALGVELRDLYGYLIDGMQGAAGAIRSGGDAEAGGLNGIPPTQEPLARYSGVVKVGPDGTAIVEFEIPAFNGAVKVMAAAWTKSRVGSADRTVTVRDPVVVSGTLPRFLNIGDRSRLRLDLDNVEAPAGDYTLDLNVAGPILVDADALRRTIRLAQGGKGDVTIPIAAAGLGDAVLDIRLTGQGLDLDQSFRLRIQPGTGSLVRRTVRPLEAGGTATITSDLLADLVPGTGAVSVSVSPLAALDVPGLLQALDRFPYGCTEQTVSRALPLLYVNRLATAEHLGFDDKLDERVRGAIERVLTRQDSNGAFGLWSVNSSEDYWLDSYVADFLTRAREQKFAVPQTAFTLVLDRLRNYVANTTEIGANGDTIAYAAYVLARNGRPVAGDLRYMADTRLDEFKTPLARAQIAAGLGLIGDRERAQRVFASAVQLLERTRDGATARPDYGTRLRDGAALVALASDTGLGRDAIVPITRVVSQERGARSYTSTQEQAWMILAAEALQRDATAIQVTLDGQPVQGSLFRTFRGPRLERAPVRVGNAGSASAELVVSVAGNPVGPEPAASRGYAVERSYYKLDGTKVDPGRVRQGDRLVTVLKVTEPQALFARVLLVDFLPAGFEIDNPKLVDSGSVAGLDWLKIDVTPVNEEYRDDRFVAAFDRDPSQKATWTVAYTVRAVAPGRYVHPAATVEDMYRPDRFGRTAFGSVEVTPR